MDISEVLTKAGYKLTKPRLAVLEFLRKVNKPVSAKEISRKIESVDQASVYRTLSMLDELDLVNVELLYKEKLYCLNDHPHHHILCRSCGYSEEFACLKKEEYTKFKNFTNIQHHLTLTGVCLKCKSKI